MYFLPLIIITIFLCFEIGGKDKKHILFNVAFVLLTLMICLRYGQGTDYFGYLNVFLRHEHGEIGYTLLQSLFSYFNLPFELMIAIISLFQMVCIYRAIMHQSPYKLFSLLLLYPTIYLTYFFSAIRQGIVIAFFLGFMIEWLMDNKWIKYILACLILALFHSSALVLLPLIIVKKLRKQWLFAGLICAAAFGVFVLFAPAEWFSFIKIGAVQYHIKQIELSPLGIAERTVMLGIITILYRRRMKDVQEKDQEKITLLYKIYFVSYIIAIAFFPWQLLSSRLGAAMKAVEIILIPMFAHKDVSLKKCIVAVMILYTFVMTSKNIYSYINQNNYEGYNIITYPYYSLWDKEEAKKAAPEMWEDIQMWLRMQQILESNKTLEFTGK